MTEPFFWKQTYETGLKQIDRDHRAILELANVLYSAIQDDKGKEAIIRACQRILSYTVEHFAREEKYMEASDFPDTEDHKAEHARLIEEARELMLRIKLDVPGGTTEIYHVLKSIFIDHVPEYDMPFADYFLARKD
ncbi:MAG: hemerythrin family protein [Desulfobulbus sp.]|nr:hemerythrin family protein [Desulfobulbus sp.]